MPNFYFIIQSLLLLTLSATLLKAQDNVNPPRLLTDTSIDIANFTTNADTAFAIALELANFNDDRLFDFLDKSIENAEAANNSLGAIRLKSLKSQKLREIKGETKEPKDIRKEIWTQRSPDLDVAAAGNLPTQIYEKDLPNNVLPLPDGTGERWSRTAPKQKCHITYG